MMKIKLRDIKGLLPEKKEITGGVDNRIKAIVYNRALQEIGEREIELNINNLGELIYFQREHKDSDELARTISYSLKKIIQAVDDEKD